MTKTTFTSESVCAGHPDKICDQISDAILDAVLVQDPQGRTAIECLAGNNRLIIAGEIGAKAKVDFKKIAREQITRLGYTDPKFNFSDQSPIEDYVHEQSPEIAVGVKKKGAGDQGMMFGFACRETKSLMPIPITIAHALTKKIDEVREGKILSYLRPDGKSQVTIEYKNGKPYRVTKVVIAVPHKESVELSDVKNDLYKKVVKPVLEKFDFKINKKDLIVNGTGIWHKGGPASDCGLTGKKIVAQGLAYKAEVILAYFIGAKKPVMQEVETFGTEKKPKKIIKDFMNRLLDTSVAGIIDGLDLRRPIYLQTAAYGHFGRPEFPWEKIV